MVYSPEVIDPEDNDLNYWISGTDHEYFNINPENGELTLLNKINCIFHKKNIYIIVRCHVCIQ